MSAGGKRKGAGRPPLSPDRKPVAITVRVPREVAARFANYATFAGISQAKLFALCVRKLGK